MKIFYFVIAGVWGINALLRVPIVESWALFSDGEPNHWWGLVGLRVVIALACLHLAILTRRIDKLEG